VTTPGVMTAKGGAETEHLSKPSSTWRAFVNSFGNCSVSCPSRCEQLSYLGEDDGHAFCDDRSLVLFVIAR
jgi:hypothetical protein